MSLRRVPFFLWALVVFLVLLVLQLIPTTGIILWAAGASVWCGLAVHVFLLGLLVEAARRRIPRFLVIVPLAAYGSYYVIYAQQSREIHDKARQMQASNPSLALRFDPARHALVLPASQAEPLASGYDVPVAYEVSANSQPEGYLSYRLMDGEQCARVRVAIARVRGQPNVSPAAIYLTPVRSENVRLTGVCVLRFPEKPGLQQIVVTTHGDDEVWKRKRPIMEQFVDFSLNGEVFATYRTASVWRLPALPMFAIGCGLNGGNASWDCFADFLRTYEVIDGSPRSVDKALYDSPASIVLGLRKYRRQDYANFKADGRSSAAIDRIDAYPQEQVEQAVRKKAELFAQFAEFVRDSDGDIIRNGAFVGYRGATSPPDDLAAAVLGNVDRLIPLRDVMIARFIQLMRTKASMYDHWHGLLKRALIALPRDAYAAMPDQVLSQLLDAVASPGGRDLGYLYERAADAGPRTLSFYEGELLKGKILSAALAICRIGQASEGARAILRDRFRQLSASDTYDPDVATGSAIYVALVRLGDPAAVDSYPTKLKRTDVVDWYEAVRQGKGRTDIGPNNCQNWDAQGFRDRHYWLPPTVRPGLIYNSKTWIEAATN